MYVVWGQTTFRKPLYPRPDSNRHPVWDHILSVARLPFRHVGIFWLRRPDSNGEYKCQKLGCYHYTTAQVLLQIHRDGLLINRVIFAILNPTVIYHSIPVRFQRTTFHKVIVIVVVNHRFEIVKIRIVSNRCFHCFVINREPARAVGL